MDHDRPPLPSAASSTPEPQFQSLDDIESGMGNETLSRSCRKNSSIVWSHFDRFVQDGVKKAKCKKCTKVYVIHGTSNLKKHVKYLCSERNRQNVGVGNVVFEQSVFRRLVAEALVLHNLPFKFVEYKGIRRVFSYLNSLVGNVSRNTIKSDILNIYETEKEKIKKELISVTGRICLTSDMWTSIKSNGYMTVTAHYVDNEWELQRRVLIFRHVPPPHDGQSVGKQLIGFLKEWGIDRKIFSITLDNASYNQVVVDLLKHHLRLTNSLVCGGEFLHVRCAAHILNLIVHEGLKIVDYSVEKIRDSIKYVRGSGARIAKFEECVEQLGLQSSKSLKQDTPTRWNSTYLMIESALSYKLAFFELEIVDHHYKCCPTAAEWNRVEKIANFLQPFFEMTELFSGSKYPTANLYFLNVWKIQLLIREELLSEGGDMKTIAEGMKTKFDKYWDTYSPILSIAFVLDPRYKLKFVELAFRKVDVLTATSKVNELKRQMKDLFDEYLKVTPSTSAPSSSSRGAHTTKVDEYMEEFDAILSQGERERGESQVEQYLLEPLMDRKKHAHLDLLAYWEQNDKYPDLALMARDVLCLPITTVASESVFSHGGRIIGKYRTSILPTNAEAVICGRDWLEAYDSEDEEVEELSFNIQQRS